MKKYIGFISCFIFSFLLFFSLDVSAKSINFNELDISFGSGDILNINYVEDDTFKIRGEEDNYHFYFNGVKHILNNNFTLIDNSIVVENDRFWLNNESFEVNKNDLVITSSSKYEFYGLSINVTFRSEASYDFYQVLCYKYGQVEECNEDISDRTKIDKDSSYNFYYDFLPFYDQSIEFDYLSYKFSLKKDNMINELAPLTFNKNEINYDDYFILGSYTNVNINNKNEQYIMPSLNKENGLYMQVYLSPPYEMKVERKYRVKFYVCLGDLYSDCNEVYSSDNQTTLMYKIYSIPLTGISYDKDNKSVDYKSFKLKSSYVCISNCEYNRAENDVTYTNEEVYHINLGNPMYEGELNGKEVNCSIYICYGSNNEITNKVFFSDDSGIDKVYYLVTNNRLESKIESLDLINNEIINGTNITFGKDLEGYYYLYYKVLDGSGFTSSNLNNPYIYLFDKKGPEISKDNFDDYSSDVSYNNVSLNVTYSDDNFNGAYKIFYKVIKESEYSSITKEEIIDSLEYNGNVDIHELISEDGVYRVCFVGQDYLENYGNFECSDSYYLDITKLSKEEVSVSRGNLEYQKEINLLINISQVEEGISFKCKLVLKDIIIYNQDELSSTCYNKQNTLLNVIEDGEYNLWIYASDASGNFNLIKLDEIYLLDGKSPIVSFTIEGDYQNYSSNVLLTVSVQDFIGVDFSSLEYSFYIDNYDEKEFLEFNIEDKIAYPNNYYGNYKIAIKACDLFRNCNINTYDTIFLINTLNIVYNVNEQNSNDIEVLVDISYSDIDEFKCGFISISDLIESEEELKYSCYNGDLSSLKVENEDKYNLWIYINDAYNNYSLIKLDGVYELDGLAPRVSYKINGNNNVYSNNVSLDVSVEDFHSVNLEKLEYVFYLDSYEDAQFKKVKENKIEYPFDYYGEYKIAIRACDVLNNCKTNTYSDLFFIDTSEIKLRLIGEEKITIFSYQDYKELGVIASKGKDNIRVDYKIDGEINEDKPGIYYINYISGEGINEVVITRIVVVKNSIPYIVCLIALFVIGEVIILRRLFIKKRKNDSI